MADYTLPDLPYDYSALEPNISGRIMELHHDKHHKAYVDKLNQLTEGSPLASKSVEEVIRAASAEGKKVLFNQAAQHYNHSFYWNSLTPHGSKIPPAVTAQLDRDFGSVEKFKEQFADSGVANFGSGWTWLVWDTAKGKTVIVNTSNAEAPLTTPGLIPLLTVDVWEHAYYVDFENRRPEYLKKFWTIVNWSFVEHNLTAATAK